MPQTPDQWLLRRYDRGTTEPEWSYMKRPIFQVLDDHPDGIACEAGGSLACFSGEARWPEPLVEMDLGEVEVTLEEEDVA